MNSHEKQEQLHRRAFLRQVAAWSVGAAVGVPLFKMTGRAAWAQIAAESHPTLAVVKGKDYFALAAAVLEPLGGIGKFVKRGDKVVIKPNIGWDRSPEQAANTHPLLVKAMAQLALDAGAAQVKIFDRSCNDPRRCYANSGIEEAVNSIGDKRVQIEHMDRRGWVPVKIADSLSLDQWEFYRDAIEADCYINLPIAKHHGSAKLTLGLKNTMGVIGGNRGQIHRDLSQRIADLNLIIRPKVTVIDATRILLRHGPQGGSLDDVKVLDTVIASADPLAADAYATTLFGMTPEQLPSTVAGAKLGLGQMDLSKVNLIEKTL